MGKTCNDSRCVRSSSSHSIFIDAYGLDTILQSTVSTDEIAINYIDQADEIRSLISYIIGKILGNFSMTSDNLPSNHIIPLTEDVYFKDDIINTFILYIEYIFGKDLIENNLDYISASLNKKPNETSRQCIRRYLVKDFYKDHVKLYQKRPIYWLFDSGKENGFKALISMYDYNDFTIAKVRTDYLHVLQKKYEVEIQRFQNLIEITALSTKDRTNHNKQIEKLKKQLIECHEYDQIVAHLANERISIDLDDGVKVNLIFLKYTRNRLA